MTASTTSVGDELLTAETVPAYLSSRRELAGVISGSDVVSVEEVGDGNLNLVFIVKDGSGRGIVLKQSLPHVRTDPDWPMTRERSTREATVLAEHHLIDPEHVPTLYGYDPIGHVLAISELSDHAVWRRELTEGRDHAYAAAELGRYVARTSFATSVFGLGSARKRALVATTANVELSEITEDLVFAEPFTDHPHNGVLPGNDDDVAAMRADAVLRREIGLARIAFQNESESLLHGDLHTGSVLVRDGGGGDGAGDEDGAAPSVKAFDAEFGVYGPTGFDLGQLHGNLVIAQARAAALGDGERADRLGALPADLWRAFEAEYRALWPTRVEDRVFGDEVLDSVLDRIRSHTAVFAAAECIRRVVGFAKATDLETLDDEVRVHAARAVLRSARVLAVDRLDDAAPDALAPRVADAIRSAVTD